MGVAVAFSYGELEEVQVMRRMDSLYFTSLRGESGDQWTFHRLSARADMTLLDGGGNTHPRGVGLAAHLGAELDLPTIGYVTSRL